jgi:CubicO group peptidase (beta-lactamase class C family)
MKNRICTLLLVINLLSTLTFEQARANLNQAPANLNQAPANLNDEIKRVETGLIPQFTVKGDPGWTIEERMKFYKVPGLSVAVIKDFKIEWAKGYGVKDLHTKEPVTTDTLFQAGSISKSVNAAIAMKKVEQGKISLDENINDKLVSWKLPENELTAKSQVTLRKILSHTAGTTVHGFPGYAIDEKIPTLPQILDGAPPANTAPIRVDIEPGTQYRYSGGGITISQLALTDIEKKSYPQIANETVLKPLGMTNSTYNQPLPANWRPKAATGYRTNGQEVEGKIHIYPEMAAAGLWTTPTDLAKFAIEMQLSLAGRSNKILTKQSVETMTTPVKEDAGLGFFIDKHGNDVYFGHGGSDEGFTSQLLVSKDKGCGVAVMINSDAGAILEEVVRAVAKAYDWDEFLAPPYDVISMDKAKLEAFTGRYRVYPDRVLTLKVEPHDNAVRRNKLVAYPTTGQPFELLPISETTFVRTGSPLKYEFLKEDTANPTAFTAVRIFQANQGTKAPRISADDLTPFELMMSGKVDEAMQRYRQIKKDTPQNQSVNQGRLLNDAYNFVQAGKMNEGIALFKVAIDLYPQSTDAYDLLADAYETNGQKDLAIAMYKRSLEVNPQNANARARLKKLGGPGQ